MSAIDSQSFAALGQDWTIRFDFNAICDIEERSGEKFMVTAAPFLDLIDTDKLGDAMGMVAIAQKVDFANLRKLLFLTLREAHPDIQLRTAGEIVKDIGLAQAVQVVALAIAKALPQGTEGDASGDANPPKRRPSTRKSTKKGSGAAKAG